MVRPGSTVSVVEGDADGTEPDYDLYLPFVCVESDGGPYEDRAFAAGWQCGEIAALLASAGDQIATFDTIVYRGVAAQLDLVAMDRGFVCTTEDTDEDDWVHVTFRPATPLPGM